MNTDFLTSLTSWHPIEKQADAVTLVSPFTFGDDGACIAFTVLFPNDEHFVLTDFAEHMMLADSYGTRLDKAKFQALNQTHGVHSAHINEDGEICASGSMDYLQDALFDAAKLALSLSFRYPKWLPKFQHERFRSMVGKALYAHIDKEKIQTNWETKGASGHTIKFPFAINIEEGRRILIDTIAASSEKIDWPLVYQTHGRMYDLKQIDTFNKRVIVMESVCDTAEFGRASSFLADTASIRTLETGEWFKELQTA